MRGGGWGARNVSVCQSVCVCECVRAQTVEAQLIPRACPSIRGLKRGHCEGQALRTHSEAKTPKSYSAESSGSCLVFTSGKSHIPKKSRNPLEPKDGLCSRVAGCGPTLLIKQHDEKSLNSVQQGLMTEGRSFGSKEMFHVVKYSLFNYKHAIHDSFIHAQIVYLLKILVFDPIY